MSKSRDTKPESSDTAEPQPVQSPGSASHVSPSPGKVETTKVKKGIWRTYDATDGLPGEPNHLLQDRRGYLWIGTNAGLCRYKNTGDQSMRKNTEAPRHGERRFYFPVVAQDSILV